LGGNRLMALPARTVQDPAAQLNFETLDKRTISGGVGPPGPAGPAGPTGPAGADGLPRVVQDEGVALAVRNALNYKGPIVVASDDAANSRTNVTLALDALSATVPDKIAWESPAGTDVVEVWGEDVSASAFADYFADLFATDTLKDPTQWSTPAGAAASTITYAANGLASGHGSNLFPNTGAYTLIPVPTTSQPRTADREVKFKMALTGAGFNGPGNNFNRFGAYVSYVDASNWVYAKLEGAGSGDPYPLWWNVVGAGTGILASFTSGTLLAPTPAGTPFTGWLVFRKVGNVVTMELWTTDPALGGSPYSTSSYTLTGAAATNHGGGVVTKAGIGTNPGSFPGTNVRIGDYTVRDKGGLHRRLMMALTPSAGSRQVFPLMDLLPDGTVASALTTQELNSTGLTDVQIDALLTFTARNGNLVSDPTNKLLLVRQGGVWTKTLVQGGAAGGDLAGTYPNPTLKVGAVDSSKVLDGSLALADLSATGTKDATTFLRGDNTFAVPPAGGGSGHTIQDEGVSLTARALLDFQGAGVTATDNSGAGKTVVSIPGGGGSAPARVTSLPGSPVDGQEVYYVADATNGVIWHLRYNAGSASAYKWEFVGGPDLYAEVQTGEGTASATFADLATVGPSITVPLAGDYLVSIGVRINATTAAVYGRMSFAVGATAAAVNDSAEATSINGTSGLYDYMSAFQTTRKLAVAAAAAIVAKYNAGGATATFQNRRLLVAPIRVG
jgi:hypothetical protein